MKRVLPIFTLVILVVFASCTAESIEPLQEQIAIQSEQGGTLKNGQNVRLNGKKPLIVVFRGEKKVNVDLLDVDPKDIKSINVLKNLAAINAYGPEAKDGVVIIYLKD